MTPRSSDSRPPLLDLTRVNVIGTSGSGKSTFARKLSQRLNAPLIEMDRLFWERNWQEVDTETFRKRVADAIGGERWVLDGNYHSKTQDIKSNRVTAIIWLDFSFTRTVGQAFGRAITRIRTQQEIWPGTDNRETFRRTFLSHESVLLWTITSFGRIRRRYAAMMTNPELDHDPLHSSNKPPRGRSISSTNRFSRR